MFKMSSHPTVFIIVMEQGELGKGRDEKDFCFLLYFSTSSDGFPSQSRKPGVELELWGGRGGGAGGHCAGGLIKRGPQKRQNQAALSCTSGGVCVGG